MGMRKYLTALGLLASVALTNGQNLETKLGDYQSISESSKENVYIVGPVGMAPPAKYTDLPEAISATEIEVTEATPERRFLIYPGTYSAAVDSNVTLVGLGPSLVKDKYQIAEDFASPKESVQILNKINLQGKQNVKLVNIFFNSSANQQLTLDQSENIILFNNFIKGHNDQYQTDGVYSALSKNVLIDNNVIVDCYRIMQSPPDPDFAVGAAVVIDTNLNNTYNVKLRRNIIARSGIGIRSVNAPACDMGTTKTLDSGDNAFLMNINYNLKIEMGNVDAEIYAQGNTFYPVLLNKAGGLKPLQGTDLETLIQSQTITSPLTILDPDILSTMDIPLGMKIINPLSNSISLQGATQNLYIYPFNFFDPLGRIGTRRNFVNSWMDYE